MSDVPAKSVEFLWRGYLPLGVLIMLDGEPGQGKSTVTYDLAARLSRGEVMPDGSPGMTADTILLNAEDDPARVIRPRLDAAGADPSRIHIWPDENDPLVLDAAGIRGLDGLVASTNARLVVIDPVVAFLPERVNTNSDADVRQVLAPLARIAEQRRTTFILVRHLNKNEGASALNRGGGSIGFVGASRSAFIFGPIPGEDAARRALAPIKGNLNKKPPTLAGRLAEAPNGTIRIEWEGIVPLSADDLLRREQIKGAPRRDAEALLLDALSNGPRKQSELAELADAEGISGPTLNRAKKTLGITSKRVGQGGDGYFVWSLPDTSNLINNEDDTDPSIGDHVPGTEHEAIDDHVGETATPTTPAAASDVLQRARRLGYPTVQLEDRLLLSQMDWVRLGSPTISEAVIQSAHAALIQIEVGGSHD